MLGGAGFEPRTGSDPILNSEIVPAPYRTELTALVLAEPILIHIRQKNPRALWDGSLINGM